MNEKMLPRPDKPAVTADVVIVGAGPSGCAAAYDLADAGIRVLLLDRSRFPRRKVCAGGLTVKAFKSLRYSITFLQACEKRMTTAKATCVLHASFIRMKLADTTARCVMRHNVFLLCLILLM